MGDEDRPFELLAALTARLASTAKLDEIVDTVLAEIAHLGFGAVWMAALDESSGNLVTIKEVIDGVDTTHEMPRIFMLDMRQPVGHGFRERRMINIPDPDSLLIIDDDSIPVPPDRLALPRVIYDHLRGHPFACGPLLGSRGQPVGAIGLSSYQGRKPIPDELFEHGLLRAFMNHLGIAMERAANVARLERLNAELLKAQAAIESSARIKAVGELATAVAHDLNNLSGIALLAVSAGMQSPSVAYDVLPRIERANRMIGELVGRLQRVAREAHRTEDVTDVACPHQIIEDMLAMLGPLLHERAIEVEVQIDPVPAVRAEPSFIHQLILNLVLNAQDALEEVTAGPRRLRIALRRDGENVLLEVTDNGPGIAADVMPRLFQPFVTTKSGGHAGLGLAASAASLKHLGGRIDARNLPEGGAQLSVTLPIAPPAPAPVAVGEPPAVHAHRGAVLAIDDDEDILDVVRAFLDTLGYEVVTTTDTEQALLLATTRAFDIVLCDVGMPKRNGLELTQLLRSSGYRGKLVLMTGWDTHRVEIDQRSKACDLLLKKPFLGSDLIHAINKLFAS